MDHASVDGEHVPGGALAERVVLELTGPADGLDAVERELAELDGVGIALHEGDPAAAVLRTGGWQVVVVSALSAGGLKMLRDVLVAHISSKRVKITVTRAGTKKSVTFEGPVGNPREVENLVHEITADKPPG